MEEPADCAVPLKSGAVTARAAGEFRRTAGERSDQRVSWERSDEAFFAAGACHILAWACRDAFPEQPVGLAAMMDADQRHVVHVYATWHRWAYDFSGWHPESELLAVNTDFEGYRIQRAGIPTDLADFCADHLHRMPHQYWRDPVPRARAYLGRHTPPWAPHAG